MGFTKELIALLVNKTIGDMLLHNASIFLSLYRLNFVVSRSRIGTRLTHGTYLEFSVSILKCLI